MKKRFLLLLFFWMLIPTTQVNAELETGGAFRQILQWQKWPKHFATKGLLPHNSNQIHQSLLRLWLNKDMGKVNFKFELEFNSLHQSLINNQANNWSTVTSGNRMTAWKTDAQLLSRPHSQISSNIERFEFAFSRGEYDFQIGRQPISLGTSHYLSVLDVVAPFYPGYLDSSYKPGVDALRIRTLAGETGEMELIAVAARNPSHNTLLARYRNTFNNFDIELVGGKFRDRNFAGIGWEGERREINFWGELGIFERLKSTDPHLGGPFKDYAVSWIAGAEKDLGKDYRGGIAYMHQDFGARQTKDYQRAYSALGFQQNWLFLGACDYSLITITREMNPLTNFSLNSIVNLVDGSIRYQPMISISIDDNSDIAFFAWLNTGKSSEINAGVVKQNSEFGSAPNGGGIIYRAFF